MLRPTILLVCTLALLSSCSTSESNTATTDTAQAGPVAKKIAHEMQEHGKVRTDDYFWMRLTDEQKEATTPDAQTQDVLDYLNAENAYQKEVLAHADTLQMRSFRGSNKMTAQCPTS